LLLLSLDANIPEHLDGRIDPLRFLCVSEGEMSSEGHVRKCIGERTGSKTFEFVEDGAVVDIKVLDVGLDGSRRELNRTLHGGHMRGVSTAAIERVSEEEKGRTASTCKVSSNSFSVFAISLKRRFSSVLYASMRIVLLSLRQSLPALSKRKRKRGK
jgi:hypothetical protein